MPTPPLPDELLLEAVEAWERNDKKKYLAARELGLHANTFDNRLKRAFLKGLHLSDGARAQINAGKLSGAEAKSGWQHVYDDEGKKVGTTYWRAPDISEETARNQLEEIRAIFEGITSAAEVAAPQHCDSDLLTLYPIADAHIGMMAWGEETGEDYDTKIATDRLQSWMGQAVASSPASDTAIILSVGDLTHADDQSNQTFRSKHILDVDTRHFKTLDMTIVSLVTCIDLARAKHQRLIVRILPGNHDPHTYMAVLFALHERYRNDERVQVQKEPGEFFVHQFGKCLIAAHHGDKAKAQRIVMYLADQFAGAWGKTVHRFLWTGHLHHHKSEDIGGCTWEQLRAVTAKDAYASSHAYSARAQLQSITYHRIKGEVQRAKISA